MTEKEKIKVRAENLVKQMKMVASHPGADERTKNDLIDALGKRLFDLIGND